MKATDGHMSATIKRDRLGNINDTLAAWGPKKELLSALDDLKKAIKDSKEDFVQFTIMGKNRSRLFKK